MITIFNRKELICTFDMKEQGEIRNALEQNGIQYQVKAVTAAAPLRLQAELGLLPARREKASAQGLNI